MVWYVLCAAFWMCPFLQRIHTIIDDIVPVRPAQIRIERYVEREIDRMAGYRRIWRHRGASDRALAGLRRSDGEVLLIRVLRSRHAEAHRGRHLLPPVSGLASEVGDLVHDFENTVTARTGGLAGGGSVVRANVRIVESNNRSKPHPSCCEDRIPKRVKGKS